MQGGRYRTSKKVGWVMNYILTNTLFESTARGDSGLPRLVMVCGKGLYPSMYQNSKFSQSIIIAHSEKVV